MEDTIIALLNNNLRVIIPDFGAFIIRQKQPRIIVFNEFLRYNDGILIDFIVKTEGIDYDVAEQRVMDFAEDGSKLLASGRELIIKGLGSLRKDSSGKINFIEASVISGIENEIISPVKNLPPEEKEEKPLVIEQEVAQLEVPKAIASDTPKKPKSKTTSRSKSISKKVPAKAKTIRKSKPLAKSIPAEVPMQVVRMEENPPAEIPGSDEPMPVITSPEPELQETEFTRNIVTPPVKPPQYSEAVETSERSGPGSTNRILAWVLIILFVNAAILAWFVFRNKTKGTPEGKIVTTMISDTVYDQLADSVRAAAMDSNIVYDEVPAEEESPAVNALAPGSRYYIVAGCFRDEINADSLVTSLKIAGYKAEKFGKIGNLYAVSFASFDNKDLAVTELKKIREKIPSAWMTKF
jgi:nucleoid DNA-binding protein